MRIENEELDTQYQKDKDTYSLKPLYHEIELMQKSIDKMIRLLNTMRLNDK